jgi:hypothetical protein
MIGKNGAANRWMQLGASQGKGILKHWESWHQMFYILWLLLVIMTAPLWVPYVVLHVRLHYQDNVHCIAAQL